MLADAAAARQVWSQVHAAVRAVRVGELTPPAGRWDGLSDEAHGTAAPDRYLIHRSSDGVVDGVATFRRDEIGAVVSVIEESIAFARNG